MNKEAILKTVIWSRDSEDGSLVVESPLMPDLVGVGPTKQEAWESFNIFLDSAYTAYLEDRLGGSYGRRGRPSKDNFEIHIKVKETTKTTLKDLAEKKECSQGEVIDYLTAFHTAANSDLEYSELGAHSATPILLVSEHHSPTSISDRVTNIESRMSLLEKKFGRALQTKSTIKKHKVVKRRNKHS